MPFDHFGIISGLFNRMPAFNTPARLLDLLDLNPQMLLLDAGGGTGRVADALRINIKRIVVDDISRPMLKYAGDKGFETTCAPIELLPFASGTFDRIIMVDALHHVFNAHKSINELWRVLSAEGVIVIIEPDIRKVFVKLVAIAEKILLMRSHFLSKERIATLFSEKTLNIQIIEDGYDIWIRVNK